MARIIIENLKSISRLEFDIPPNGVHVLTGINGSGKTTLLACLQRLTDSYAFQKLFKTSSNNQFDNFQNSRISYENNGSSVTYIYRNTRWSPNPRIGAALLATMGFNNAVFIASTIERFYVQNAELNTRGITTAPQFFKDSMNEIFQTTKYNDLRRKKLDGKGRGYGRWNYGFLMPSTPVGGLNRYYTERNFSLGELLILNALFQLENLQDSSLVLIDEVELALHPKVQVRFLRFLKRIATEKDLTIILSTHSSSLIKAADKLIFLQVNSTGVISVEDDCYPAVALQAMAVQEEVQPDVVFCVEDNNARFILEEILNYYFRFIFHGRKPIYKTLPIGGWRETIRFAQASVGYLIPQQTRVMAMLDADVLPPIQLIQANANRTQNEQHDLDLYNNNIARCRFLPITPELGIVQLLNTNPHNHIQPLQDHFNGVFDIEQIIYDEAHQVGVIYSANPRAAAKKRLDFYVERIHSATNRDYNYVRMKLAEYYALNYCPSHHNELQQLLNPIFQ